jgi:hypothetical protein
VAPDLDRTGFSVKPWIALSKKRTVPSKRSWYIVEMEAEEDGMTGEVPAGTRRFRAKRDAILAAAAGAINEQSAKGMTFADVARRVGLNTTSVTYYFRRKEELAAAAFENTLDRLTAMLEEARRATSPSCPTCARPRIRSGAG